MKRFASVLAMAAILGFPVMLAVALPGWVPGPAAAQSSDGESEGQAIFVAQRCNMCHSVEALGIEATTQSERMRASDLSKVGAKLDAELIARYVKKQEQIDGEEHKPAWRGSDEELATLAGWLAALK
jgi:mono/diheme cytochrome c family protein